MIRCIKCQSDLEAWNNNSYLWIHYCPQCGKKLPDEKSEKLFRKTTDLEISDMIQERILEMSEDRDEINTEDMAWLAWERENTDGVVFYNDYKADMFCVRHSDWVDGALDYCFDNFGSDHYLKMKADCSDKFLVTAFICATEDYLYNQIGVDRNEGLLSKERVKEIKKLVKETEYKGGHW
jgi:hypothetical protein